MKYRISLAVVMFVSMLFALVGCQPKHSLHECVDRHYTVHMSTKLTASQHTNFENAMTTWTNALGPGFWTWESQDVELDLANPQEVRNQADDNPCLISVIPADTALIGADHAGLATIEIDTGNNHLLGGVVDILDTFDDDASLSRICLHEIGHLLDLDDNYTNTGSIMYWSIGGPPIQGLPASDVAEVKKLWNVSQ